MDSNFTNVMMKKDLLILIWGVDFENSVLEI